MVDNTQAKNSITIPQLCLATQRALLGAIGSSILGICLELEDNIVQLIVYLVGQVSEDQFEELDIAATEIMAYTGAVIPVELKLIEQAQSPLDYHATWVFVRMGCLIKPQ